MEITMEPKELVDAGVCVSMAEARRLSANMKTSSRCNERVRAIIREKQEEQEKMHQVPMTTTCPKCDGDGCWNCNGTGEIKVFA